MLGSQVNHNLLDLISANVHIGRDFAFCLYIKDMPGVEESCLMFSIQYLAVINV